MRPIGDVKLMYQHVHISDKMSILQVYFRSKYTLQHTGTYISKSKSKWVYICMHFCFTYFRLTRKVYILFLIMYPKGKERKFYMHHPTDRITHITAFVTPVVEY